MGKRPHSTAMGQQQLPVEVPVPKAKHASPRLRHSGGPGEAAQAGCCTSSCGRRRQARTQRGRLPRAGRAPSTRRHCTGGSSVTPALPRPVAAVVKDPLLEERRELTNGVFGKGQPHLADVQGGRRRLEHHAEKVPEVFLRKRQEPKHG